MEIATEEPHTHPHTHLCQQPLAALTTARLREIARDLGPTLYVGNVLDINFFKTPEAVLTPPPGHPLSSSRRPALPSPPTPALVARLFELKIDLAVEMVGARDEKGQNRPETVEWFRDALFFHPHGDDVHKLPLSSPLAADLYRRLHGKHRLVREAYALEKQTWPVWDRFPGHSLGMIRHRLCGPMLALSVNLGLQQPTLGVFKMIIEDYLTAHKTSLDQGVVDISARLVDTDPTLTTSFFLDYLIMLVQRLDFRVYREVMANLLRVRRIADHDKSALVLKTHDVLENMIHPLDPRFTHAPPMPARIHFAAQCLQSRPPTPAAYGQAILLFRHSSPLTAVDTWRLLVRFSAEGPIANVRSLVGLKVYSPYMTDAALAALMWLHPLAATKVIHLREQHFRSVATNQSGIIQHQSADEYVKRKLRLMHSLAEAVRCVGGGAGHGKMNKLFGSPLPSRPVVEIVSFML